MLKSRTGQANEATALWIKSIQNDALGDETLTHSYHSLRGTLFCCALFGSTALHSTPQHAAPLGGSFVKEKVVMY